MLSDCDSDVTTDAPTEFVHWVLNGPGRDLAWPIEERPACCHVGSAKSKPVRPERLLVFTIGPPLGEVVAGLAHEEGVRSRMTIKKVPSVQVAQMIYKGG